MSADVLQAPPLSKAERMLLGAVAAVGLAVGTLGLASSFNSVSRAGERWGFAEPWMLPVGIDLAIPVFTAANLLLIRLNMPLAWVRWVPWVLTAVTCWLNVAAGQSLSAKVAHGSMPLLWVVLSEIAGHVYAVRIGVATGRRMEKIRRSRWLLAFPSTFALWRRMTLWEMTSYREALECEKRRQLARADLRERHGKQWRRHTPRRELVLLKLGELAPNGARPPSTDEEPEPEPATSESGPEQEPAPRRPLRGRTARRAPAAKVRRLSFPELLDKARRTTADWPYERLEAAPIRKAVGCGQARSRELREALKAERREQESSAVAA